MAWVLTFAMAATVLLYLLHQWRNPARKKNLPPGPKGLPIIGHFHLLSKTPHQDLYRLAREHGPIMYTRFGSVPTIIVSSPAAAELFLKTHDLIFANRPHNEATYYVGYEQRDIIFGRYGAYWRNMRKLISLELLSAHKIDQFQSMRKAELGILVDSLRKARETVDLSARISSASTDMICLMVFGRKFADKDMDQGAFSEVVKEVIREAAVFNLGDYFPYLRWLDPLGSTRRLRKLSKIFDAYIERIIDDHVQKKHEKEQESSQDFVDTMMAILDSGEAGFDFDRRHVKAVLLDMLVAGMDTSSTSVEWALSELIKHPTEMRKLQKELDEIVGPNQMVEESHLSSLKYLDCIIKESMRLHPVAPLLIHESMEDCVVDGFHIPNKARVLINVWGIGRDPDAWKDPERFLPQRFVGSHVDLRGRDFQLIPFGSGRRGCPGLQLGLTVVRLMLAQLVHCFDWELPPGLSPHELDMSEDFGIVASRATHLKVVPVYRLRV